MLLHLSGSRQYNTIERTGYTHNSWLIEYTLQFHMTHPFWTTLKWMNLQTSNANIRHLVPKHCHRINQRWANSVLMTEYEYEYYLTFKKWLNTNTNIIRFEKIDRIRIRILFGLKKETEYEYKYYSLLKNRPNTNTNIIWLEKITRIRILVFGLSYLNNIRIPNYSLTSEPNHCKPACSLVRHNIIGWGRVYVCYCWTWPQ